MDVFKHLVRLVVIAMSLFFFLLHPTATHAAITDGLVSFWGLNESSGSRADNIGTNTLVPSASVGNAAGKIDSAAQFQNGVTGFLKIDNNSSFNMNGGDFSISLWVYMSNKTGTQVFASKYASSGYAVYYEPIYPGFVFATYAGGGTAIANALGDPSTNTWYHIVAVHDSVANTNTIRINDQYENTLTSVTDQADTSGPFAIGGFGSTGLYVPNARVDAVGLWSRKLTAGEITTLYNSGSGTELSSITPTPTPTPTSIATNTSQSDNAGGPSSCPFSTPNGTPDLFQADVRDRQATIYFTAVSNANNYNIGYDNDKSTGMYGVQFDSKSSSGILSYTIYHLVPKTTYSFKVRGGNSCRPGNWSNTLEIKTTSAQADATTYYKNFPTKTFSQLPRQLDVRGARSTQKTCEHITRSGDTLWSISRQRLGNGAQYQAILTENHLQSTQLRVGQKLKILCK